MKPALALAVLALSACNKPSDCLDLPVYPPPGIDDPPQVAIACVETWAARYAEGPDRPSDVAEAAVEKCSIAIARDLAAKATAEGMQLETAREKWRRHALTVIAEARARRCYS